ncbi:MAG: winged helix-turn-helix domain-containing protein [Candidatus Woesearchaeota archaeon]
MPNEKFVLVSLQDDKAKKLAQVITNDSCRKILDYLAEKDATESELSGKLQIPISTVHYNLKQLVEGGLVKSEEFHYSEKGKEVNHYRLANKYIIIAPRSVYGIKEKLKSILPVVLILGVGAAFIGLFSRSFTTGTMAAQKAVDRALPPLMTVPSAAGGDAVNETASRAAEVAPMIQSVAPSTGYLLVWFGVGAVSALAIYLLVDYIRNRKKQVK